MPICPGVARAVAFQVLFSLLPFILFLSALLAFLQLPGIFDWLQATALSTVPANAASLADGVIGVLREQRPGLLSFSAAFALWAASSGVRVVTKAMNAAYNVSESRSLLKLYPLSVVCTVAIAAMLVVSAGILAVGPDAAGWLADRLGLRHGLVFAWSWLRWPAGLALLTLAAAVIFHVAPDTPHKFRLVTPGAVVAVAVWVLVSTAFRHYVNDFGTFKTVYGSIGAVIVLQLYFFLSSLILLFGAEINAVIEQHAMAGGQA